MRNVFALTGVLMQDAERRPVSKGRTMLTLKVGVDETTLKGNVRTSTFTVGVFQDDDGGFPVKSPSGLRAGTTVDVVGALVNRGRLFLNAHGVVEVAKPAAPGVKAHDDGKAATAAVAAARKELIALVDEAYESAG